MPQGLLLIEAVLAAAAIAVGLVAISRGLAGQLRALQALEVHEEALGQAQAILLEWESRRLAGRLVPDRSSGELDAQFDVGWDARAARRADWLDEAGQPTVADVRLTVSRQRPPRAALRLSPIWPADWVPASWW